MYMETLKSSGFREEFTYEPKMPNENNLYMNKENMKWSQKNRKKRKSIWFNTSFCKLVNINVGKYFLKLIDKHFKQNNILHKILNRKTFKISYSCTKNVFEIINNYNKEFIWKYHDRTNNNNNRDNKSNYIHDTSRENKQNCKTRNKCPMNGLCNLENVVYQGSIFPKENVKITNTYIGISSKKWKLSFNNRNQSFSHEHFKNQTALSKAFGNLKI